jgi:salicylate hydroxylase
VVGGGIAGLSLARELSLRGLAVTVLERASKLATVGAGIIMNPNAMAVLERNGLAASVRVQSCPYVAFFERKLQLAGVKFDLSSEGWATTQGAARVDEGTPA